ncbi:hypothetical protein O1611_g7319 [Lasiodiplodia mahajangana]|uniref:Uncharacterized protein n=1 Tax=Lasiodiplodia mahajangana TaxID=1108764 RepID=A0ACC2JFM1_9PEZI|nr:hypothetical protein O1611_g7319 [Lasiodiplodia mahajangana]
MSLLHRWSLPSRGFIRDKPPDGSSPGRSKFPTIHIGQPILRRRANLSSAFLPLFEKPENRQRVRNAECSSEAADDLPLLAPRRENAPSDTNLRYSNAHKYQATASFEGTPLRTSSQLEFTSKNTEAGGMKPSPCFTPGNQIDEAPKIRSFSLSSTNTTGKEFRDEALALQSMIATDGSERVRSATSSYPSEGIRSPATSCRSPEPVTSRTMKYLAEYRCYGRYPSESMCDLANLPISEECAGGTVGGTIQAANTAGDTPFDSGTASPNARPSSPHLVNSPRDATNLALRNVFDGGYEHDSSSSTSRSTALMFEMSENENTISSQREANLENFQRLDVRDPFDDYHSCQTEDRHAASTDRLRLSGDTDSTILTAIRRSSIEGEEDTWSTIHGVGEKRLSRPASWLQLFAFPTSSPSSNTTLTQRIQKLRLRKWVKRACFKTKARFRLVGRRVSTAKRTSSGFRRRKWRYIRKKRIPTKKAKKNAAKQREKRWSVGKTLDATKEIADDFFGSLAKRKSLQFGLFRSEKGDKDLVAHKRVQSCPASIHS